MGVKKLAIVESGNAFYETALAFKTTPSAVNWAAHVDAMKAYQVAMTNREADISSMLAFTNASQIVPRLAEVFDRQVEELTEDLDAGRARIVEMV